MIVNNERDNDEVARVLGLTKVFNLNYRNHRMDNESRQEMRGRFIHLFRLLKVDTVVCYDPWGHYEENPDHYVTAQVVESACWMAGSSKDYVEQLAAGLSPTACARGTTSPEDRSWSTASWTSAPRSIGRWSRTG